MLQHKAANLTCDLFDFWIVLLKAHFHNLRSTKHSYSKKILVKDSNINADPCAVLGSLLK